MVKTPWVLDLGLKDLVPKDLEVTSRFIKKNETFVLPLMSVRMAPSGPSYPTDSSAYIRVHIWDTGPQRVPIVIAPYAPTSTLFKMRRWVPTEMQGESGKTVLVGLDFDNPLPCDRFFFRMKNFKFLFSDFDLPVQ